MREFYEKARREPKKYEKLLIERLKSLESDFKFTMTLLLALPNVMFLVSRLKLPSSIIVFMAVSLTLTTLILLTINLHTIKNIKLVEGILYGDPMDKWTLAKILAWLCFIETLIISILTILLQFVPIP